MSAQSSQSGPDVNLWSNAEHSKGYLERADSIPHRREGEATLLEFLPERVGRFLDLGSGGGRLLGLVKAARPNAEAVAVDFSAAMLEVLRDAYRGDAKTSIVEHDLSTPLPELGKFDAVVSSFAIHHVTHERKRSLYREIFGVINPGGVFLNLEHVASATPRLHEGFLAQLDLTLETEDPSNKLLDLEVQLDWLREIGFTDVDCHWKWRELALLAGTKPEATRS
ncbi:MAG TPA: class I SAM-dependent methyltransferase [Candidatus Acidoferrum sp.]|nr:class I SAM-dependent methyltransferase [Candidatus Acidoferrum sp.]